MCRPSATSAMEPNSRPPTISAIIMAPQSQITAHVLRSLFSCPSPRNTCWWKGEGVMLLRSIMAPSFQISADDFEQALRRFGIQGPRMLLGIDQMRAHMILDDLGHQTGHGTARSGDEMHDLLTAGLTVEGALDGFGLTLDAAHPRQQLALLMDGVCHPDTLPPYPL